MQLDESKFANENHKKSILKINSKNLQNGYPEIINSVNCNLENLKTTVPNDNLKTNENFRENESIKTQNTITNRNSLNEKNQNTSLKMIKFTGNLMSELQISHNEITNITNCMITKQINVNNENFPDQKSQHQLISESDFPKKTP